jgi:hypothetical protein
MEKSFDKKLKVKINKEKQSVSLSMKVSDEMVNVFKTSLNEFNIMDIVIVSSLVSNR